jgi:hypothetical protein
MINKQSAYCALKGISPQIILFAFGIIMYLSNIQVLRGAAFCLIIINAIAGIILFVKFYNANSELQELEDKINKLIKCIKSKQ